MAKNIGKNGVPNDADRIAQFFKGKHIFITGGTGFLGKVMVEKLLRDCSGVDTIYLLIRDKKGKNPSQRIEEIFNSPVRLLLNIFLL
jgi:fatty acyl-CoA reductase